MELKDVTQLEYLSFDTSCPGKYREHCDRAYDLWKTEWQKTFTELEVHKRVLSDYFLHRSLGGLFAGTRPVAFMIYQFHDFRVPATVDAEYFLNYDEDTVRRHQSSRDRVMIITYLTTDPDWRKIRTNYSVAELIFSFMILTLVSSEARRMLGYFRNNRRTNEMFYRHGGELLHRHRAYNVAVDFGELHRDRARLSDLRDHALLSVKMWSEYLKKHKGDNYEFIRNPESRSDEPPGGRLPQPAVGR